MKSAETKNQKEFHPVLTQRINCECRINAPDQAVVRRQPRLSFQLTVIWKPCLINCRTFC